MTPRALRTLLLALAVLATACTGAGGGSGIPSLSEQLALLPVPDRSTVTEIRLQDLTTAAALAEVSWPPAEGESLVDVLAPLSGVDSPVHAPLTVLLQGATGDGWSQEVRDLAGAAVEDLDWLAESSAPPVRTTVGGGRVDEAAVRGALGDGPPWRVGEGEELESDLHDPTPLDRLGRPVAVTLEDGVLGLALREDDLAPLRGEGATAADDPEIAALAGIADAEGCYSAIITVTREWAVMTCWLPEVDAGAQVLLVAADVDDAEAEAARIEEEAADPEVLDLARADAVEVEADEGAGTVTVRIDGEDDASGGVAAQLVAQLSPLVPGVR